MSKPPEIPVVFLDRSLGSRVVASLLRAAGLHVEVHDDHFPQDCPDQEWLREIGRRGWVVLMKDRHIRYRKLEREALVRNGVRAFAFARGDMTGAEMAAAFLSARPKIHRLLAKQWNPFIAVITRGGHVSLTFKR